MRRAGWSLCVLLAWAGCKDRDYSRCADEVGIHCRAPMVCVDTYCVMPDMAVGDLANMCEDACGVDASFDLTNVERPPMCSDSSTCPGSTPVCAQQVCGGCQLDADGGSSPACATHHPATPLCGPGGACVECLSKDDCDSKHQTCSTSHACGPCAANADCTSGLCCTTGTLPNGTGCTPGMCSNETSLLYVNNAPGANCNDTGGTPGSFNTPFCTLQKGLNASASTSKTVIVFGGMGYSEALLASPAQNSGLDYVATAVGVGSPLVNPSAGALLSVSGLAGKQVTLSLDGFNFDGTNAADGVLCTGDATNYPRTTLSLLRSTVRNSPMIGVSSQAKCTVTLDADFISFNKGGGIKLDTTDFALTNLLLQGNGKTGTGTGSSFGGINESAAGEVGKMSLFNLTVVDNKSDDGAVASGLQCQIMAPTITNTVVYTNLGAGGTEVQTACKTSLTYSAFVGAGVVNANHNQDLMGCSPSIFDSTNVANPYTPAKGGLKPCSLVDDGTNTGAPDHDLIGTSRPQPSAGMFDIGCYEAR
jgi:hypothetical protein